MPFDGVESRWEDPQPWQPGNSKRTIWNLFTESATSCMFMGFVLFIDYCVCEIVDGHIPFSHEAAYGHFSAQAIVVGALVQMALLVAIQVISFWPDTNLSSHSVSKDGG